MVLPRRRPDPAAGGASGLATLRLMVTRRRRMRQPGPAARRDGRGPAPPPLTHSLAVTVTVGYRAPPAGQPEGRVRVGTEVTWAVAARPGHRAARPHWHCHSLRTQ